MGAASSAAFTLGSQVHVAGAIIAGQPLRALQTAFLRFDSLSRLPGVDRATFVKIFPELGGEGGAEAVFFLFEAAAHRGKVDILEVFAAATISSAAGPAERRKFMFSLFDFDGSKALSEDEFVILIRACLMGLAKLTGGTPPTVTECEEAAQTAFHSADEIRDHKLTYVEWSNWMRTNRVAKNVTACFDRKGKLKPGLGRRGSGAGGGAVGAGGGPGSAALTSGSAGLDAALGVTGNAAARKAASDAVAAKRDGDPLSARDGDGRNRGTAADRRAAAEAREKARMEKLTINQLIKGTGITDDLSAGARTGMASSAKAKANAPRGKGGKFARPADESGMRYSRRDILQVKRLFTSLDSDSTGEVSMIEFATSLSSSVLPHLAGMFASIDRSGDGLISFPELLAAIFPRASPPEMKRMLAWAEPPKRERKAKYVMSEEEEEEVKVMFDVYDADGSGTITVRELAAAMSATGVLSAEEINGMFAAADKDTDRKMGREEFKTFYVKNVLDQSHHGHATTLTSSSGTA